MVLKLKSEIESLRTRLNKSPRSVAPEPGITAEQVEAEMTDREAFQWRDQND